MKNDESLSGRRALLRGAAGAAAVFGLGAVSGCGSSATPARPVPGAAGARAARPMKPSAYRLQPMGAAGPQRVTATQLPVRSRPILRLKGGGRSMVLTFDDGPDPRYTPGILRTLRKHDVRAMFFLCGEMVDAFPHLVQAIVDDGHVVGNHTWSHPQLTRMSRAAVRDEIVRTSEAIEEVTGESPQWFRAPYGAWNRAAFEVGAELGMEPLAWTVDSLDWTEPGTGTIIRNVMAGAGPGVVVLSHDAGGNRSQSVRALGTYLPELLDSGYRISLPRRRAM
ncbi:polysaccharide deacetylase family protein [Streptomyces sp. NBC_01304]|uniref:polysaccharide deacetylase family protein n=1 Tax=Streptomyces sp. NBC_01304 TaxID=2903818 RepID=UPI002E0DCD56|nr:polysaccharide deacetylase family protein [Streptomyces sp. NBC_01304]